MPVSQGLAVFDSFHTQKSSKMKKSYIIIVVTIVVTIVVIIIIIVTMMVTMINLGYHCSN